MSPPFAEETYSVADLCEEVKSFLTTAFPSVWVVGELQRFLVSRNGHAYFELVEKGSGDEVRAKLSGVLWRTDAERIRRQLAAAGTELADGQLVRCRGGVDFYGAAGRLQLVVREVDPLFTLGHLERRRQETLEALAREGLLERNKTHELSEVPSAIGLITSHGSAAYHDFLATLGESGYGFRVLFVHAAVQGKDAEAELVSALESLAGVPLDAVVMVRGGGSRSDLAVFDSRKLAEAIAHFPRPVVTGLGHEIDLSIADVVAHTAVKTPTKAAELLIDRLRTADQRTARLSAALALATRHRLGDAAFALASAERGVDAAAARLLRAADRLNEVARALGRVARLRLAAARGALRERRGRLALGALRRLERARLEPRRQGERIAAMARARLAVVSARLAGISRLTDQLSPQRTLERGFSITRGPGGRALRHPREVAPGDRVSTELAGGRLHSRVEEDS